MSLSSGEKKVPAYTEENLHPVVSSAEGEIIENPDELHRRLENRQVQLIAIGGTIGTVIFVSIGGALAKGGPGSLFIGYTLYCFCVAMVGNGTAEFTVLYPVSGGFIRLAGHFVDEAFGFMAGWNFFLFEGLVIPFEVTALSSVVGYWSSEIPGYAVPIACIILYGLINILAVRAYGEAEFWLSGGKIILIFLLFAFTFVTMVGGNPEHDAYGFRNWKSPNAFGEYRSKGTLGRFEGFLACIWSACFAVAGPEYVSMVAGETKRPRIYLKSAFKTMYARFAIFFIGSALACGTVIAYTDPTLNAILSGETGGSGTASASPYVIAMQNLKVHGLPHLVNALLCTSIFSAGNTYTYCATRSLYGLALEGQAPRILRHCTKSGVPIYAFAITMVFPCLSLLQVSNGSQKVLVWLINLATAGALINYIVMCITFIFYYKACQQQGLDRKSLPYYGWGQPYCAYGGLASMTTIVFTYGYSSLSPFNVQDFFIYYALLILAPFLFVFWKVFRKTRFVQPSEVDLIWQRPMIDAYEATFIDPPKTFWREMLQLATFGRKKFTEDRRRPNVVVRESSKGV